ncbi:MAG: 2'-5' RNA ligase family protein [Bryobacteraceae bacterium]
MGVYTNGIEPVNSYALVAYLPGELGRFLDDLRRELVPWSNPHSHVTVLPPRPLPVSTEIAWNELDVRLREFPAFEIEVTSVEIFTGTGVIHVALGDGRYDLDLMHYRLNSGPFRFSEPFVYHPHITLAMELEFPEVRENLELARYRWSQYRGPRRFSADTITFVQNTTANRWLDLAQWTLRAAPAVR